MNFAQIGRGALVLGLLVFSIYLMNKIGILNGALVSIVLGLFVFSTHLANKIGIFSGALVLGLFVSFT